MIVETMYAFAGTKTRKAKSKTWSHRTQLENSQVVSIQTQYGKLRPQPSPYQLERKSPKGMTREDNGQEKDEKRFSQRKKNKISNPNQEMNLPGLGTEEPLITP